MGKSDDSISRRRNKKIKRKQDDKSNVSNRIAAIIAAKKRRLTGKRRMCQGMCFSLPTLEDPFNDRHGKSEPMQKKKKKSKENKKFMDKKVGGLRKGSIKESDVQVREAMEVENVDSGKSALVNFISFMGSEIVTNLGTPTCQIVKREGSTHSWKDRGSEIVTECPSKYLLKCVDSIQNVLLNGESLSSARDKSFFASEWGLDFWNCYTNGQDVLETDGADSKTEQIAWITSTAADAITMKEKEGVAFNGPFLLYLVPSQDKAHKVREVCKPLKSFGIHAVSLHAGASLDHQINGLKSCEPEFIVSTPERLLELLSLKAVDISGVSLLVIDGLQAPFKGTYFDSVKSVRRFISGNLQTVVFSDYLKISSISDGQKLSEEGSA